MNVFEAVCFAGEIVSSSSGLLQYLFFAWKFMKASVEASTALMEASIRSMKAYGRYGTFHEEKIPEASTEASMEAVKDAAEVTSTEAFTKASTSTKASAKASTEVLQRKLPRIRKLPRKHFNGFLDLISRKQSAASAEGRKLSGFHESFHESFS